MDPPEGLQAHEPDTGLPPTPPTMTSSDVSESKPDRALSPVPLFADRVRNALESQRSGLSTPILENHSPPTPDPSPPGNRSTLIPPRPPLSHSPSSFADSFKTAHEGLTTSGDVSREHSPFEDEPSQQQRSWLHATMPVRLDGLGLLGEGPINANDTSSEEHVRVKNYPLASPYESDKSEVRSKNYVLSGSEKNDESDRGEVRVKNYQMESDSDMERRNVDESSSSTFRKAVTHNMAQRRLRKPIQPGDDVKRPNEALLYSSLGSWKGRKSLGRPQTPPRREKDTTFLRNADLVPPQTPESLIELSPETPNDEHETPRQATTKGKPNGTPKKLREFAPSESPAMLSPPNTATKERSLEENNHVYRMIQEENAKRHSAISDGSVQAKVVVAPENKRKLRHTKKRDSLRGNVSMASNSKRSSSESDHKLKHKRAMNSLGSETTPEVTPERKEDSLKFSSRISRFDPGQDGFDYWSALPDEEHVQEEHVQEEPTTAGASNETGFKPRRLRRSLRGQSLDKQLSIASESDPRPWSMGGVSFDYEQPAHSVSPKLRRSSVDRQLDRNDAVRRTSLGRESQTVSQKLDRVAQDLTREGHEISDVSSTHDRRRSSDKASLSPRKAFDPHTLRPIGTPLSVSQFSDRTGMTEAEIGEARGVQIFPHNNDSLLLIHESSLPVGALDALDNGALAEIDESDRTTPGPTFQAFVDAPEDSPAGLGMAKHTADSPLTNPRAAPEPPVIKFIPPTPNEELERPLGTNDGQTEATPRPNVSRRLSLTQKMRRYSDAFFQPLAGRSNSQRKAPALRDEISEPRPTHLSSFWQPRDFWEEYDSSDEFDDEREGEDILPPGGDTSNISDNKKRSLFPRNMSVRMPGFRGTGGFLVGNSLGLDRHGTNKRRHYIDKRTSEERMRRMAEKRRRRTFTLPFSGGTEIEYVGFEGLGTKMRESRRRRQERAAEKRREKLRGSIGTRVFHDGGAAGTSMSRWSGEG